MSPVNNKKIRVDHREGRVFISFNCHCQVTVFMISKKMVATPMTMLYYCGARLGRD